MTDRLKVAASLAYFVIICSTGAHVAGLLTNFWFAGSSDSQSSEIQEVHIGLSSHHVKYSNGTEVETETSQLRREVQYIVMAVAGTNTLMCLVVLCKSIHLCVGLIAFISLSLMILCAFYTYDGIYSQRDRLQDVYSEWPELALSWSFYLAFLGIIVNIISTMILLACLLIRGEIKAEKTKLGEIDRAKDVAKTTHVSTVSSVSNYGVNYAYISDPAHDQRSKDSGSASGYASPSSVPDAIEIDSVDVGMTGNSTAHPRTMQIINSVPEMSRDNSGFTESAVVIESIRL